MQPQSATPQPSKDPARDRLGGIKSLLTNIGRGPVQRHLAKLHPERDPASPSGWRCATCHQAISCDVAVATHWCCRGPRWHYGEMETGKLLRDGLNGRRCCVLCGLNVRGGGTHACQSMRRYDVDWSSCCSGDVSSRVHHGSAAERKCQAWLRRSQGLVVVMAPPPSEMACSTPSSERPVPPLLLLASSGLSVGLGLYAARRLEARRLVGWYVGERVAPHQVAATDLRCMKVRGQVVDPTAAGTVLALCNMGHDKCAVMEAVEERLRGTFTAALRTLRVVRPGKELLWDYQASTSDAAHPLLSQACRCGTCTRSGSPRPLMALRTAR